MSAGTPPWKPNNQTNAGVTVDREQALKANRSGAIAACISAVMTAGVVLFALQMDPVDAPPTLSFFADPLNFLDVGILLLCAFGMYRNSRTAAVFAFSYFLVSKVAITLSTGQVAGVGVALIFLYFYGRAIQGTFVFHRIEKAENPAYRGTPKWMLVVGVPVIGLFTLLLGFALLTMTGAMPATEVQNGEQVSDSEIATLRDAGVLHPDETLEYFYSYGLTSVLQGGNVVSDMGVTIYFPQDSGELAIYYLPFESIASVEQIEEGGPLSDSVYRVNGFDDDAWLTLSLSTERRGDVRFVEAIRRRLDAR